MSYVLLNIGSNLGNRRLNISRALRAIASVFGDFEMSHVVESAPLGFDSTNNFLNVGVAFATDLEPGELLSELQKIEKSISPASHRTADGGYADRVIDIDIVAIDDLVIDTPDLKVPHPGLPERDFFLLPMEELVPGWRNPLNGLTPTEMLQCIS